MDVTIGYRVTSSDGERETRRAEGDEVKLLYSTTSPFARLVRVAMIEKGLTQAVEVLSDPWRDHNDLLDANPSARVPVFILDDGTALTESQLILSWLEFFHPLPSLQGEDVAVTLSVAGVAVGGIEAAAAIIIGRRMTNAEFDGSPVGLRRRRSIILALTRLESSAASLPVVAPSLATIASVVLIDYLRFRFPDAPWLPPVAELDRLSLAVRDRPSFARTAPRDMPAVPDQSA